MRAGFLRFPKIVFLNLPTTSVNGEDVRLMLWDTAGQEEFDCITRAYYRGAQACVLAFSCVDRESFKQVARWKRKVEEECGNIPMVLVMTKMDLLYKAAMDSFEVEKMSRNLGLPLIKTSVKENLNVSKVGSPPTLEGGAGGDGGVAGVLPVGHPAPLLRLRVERGSTNHPDRRGEVHHLQSGGFPHKVDNQDENEHVLSLVVFSAKFAARFLSRVVIFHPYRNIFFQI